MKWAIGIMISTYIYGAVVLVETGSKVIGG